MCFVKQSRLRGSLPYLPFHCLFNLSKLQGKGPKIHIQIEFNQPMAACLSLCVAFTIGFYMFLLVLSPAFFAWLLMLVLILLLVLLPVLLLMLLVAVI